MRVLRTGVRAVAASLVAVLLLTVPAVGATPVLTTKAAEFNPAATDTYIAWNGYVHRHYVVYAKAFTGSRFRVNPSGTDGYVGSIEGTTLIYQQFSQSTGNSDIYSYDLVTKAKTKIGKPVSTGGWDYDPSGSGEWVLYSRYYRNADRKVFLYNTNTLELRPLASTSGRRFLLRSSQVSGNYAVWEKSEIRRGKLVACNVFLYDILGGTTTKVANPRSKCQYSPAVNPAGTVFFARSGWGCGKNTVLREQALASPATNIVSLPDGHDITSLYAVDNGGGSTDVYYDPYRCGGNADIFKVTEP